MLGGSRWPRLTLVASGSFSSFGGVMTLLLVSSCAAPTGKEGQLSASGQVIAEPWPIRAQAISRCRIGSSLSNIHGYVTFLGLLLTVEQLQIILRSSTLFFLSSSWTRKLESRKRHRITRPTLSTGGTTQHLDGMQGCKDL